MIDAGDFAQLLQRPGSSRMGRDVAVNQATGPVLNDHEHIEHAKVRCDGKAEVAGENSLSVKTHEGRPAQISSRPSQWAPGHVLAHRARGDLDAELQQKLIGDALLASDRVLRSHPSDQALQLSGNGRTARSRLQTPQRSPSAAVPAKKSLGLNNDQ